MMMMMVVFLQEQARREGFYTSLPPAMDLPTFTSLSLQCTVVGNHDLDGGVDTLAKLIVQCEVTLQTLLLLPRCLF